MRFKTQTAKNTVINNRIAVRSNRCVNSTCCCVAAAGCCSGGGCGVPSQFSGACNKFTGSGISGACQNALNVAGPNCETVLKTLPGCLSGAASGSLGSMLTAAGIDANNLVGDCLSQAQSLLSGGVPAFTNIMENVNEFCTNSAELSSMIDQAKNLNLPAGDLGFNLNNIKDTVTGGVTAQFGPLDQGFRELCNDMGNFGSLINANDLTNCFTATSIAQNLCNKGYSEQILEQCQKVGINSVDEIINGNETLIRQALENVPVDVVRQIAETTDCVPVSGELTNLSQIYNNPETFLSSEALSAAGGSVSALQEKLFNVCGVTTNAGTFQEIGDRLSELVQPEIPLLDTTNNDRTAWSSIFPSAQQTSGVLGSGLGIFGNPTIADVIGVAAGIGYTASIVNMSSAQERLAATPQGSALIGAINNIIADPSNDDGNAAALTAAAAPFVNPTDPVIIAELANAQQEFVTIANRIVREKNNLAAAKINPSQINGSAVDVLDWIGGLNKLHDDPYNLGYADFVRAVATNDVYGEAIKAAIDEGNNLTVLTDLGIRVPLPLSSEQYAANKIKTSIETAENCCPPDIASVSRLNNGQV